MNEFEVTSGVLWITGYSASGKTTIGRKVEMRLRGRGVRTIFLDGDDLRAIFADHWGYSRKDRVDLAKVYFRLCSHLSSQGFTVIISAIAMYAEVREWLRENVSNAMEVYLSVPDDIRRNRDSTTKKIYRINTKVDEMYDEPMDADIVVANHSGVTADFAADQIVAYFAQLGVRRSDKGRHEHWNKYYSSSHAPVVASPFAIRVHDMIKAQSKILEIGCGNGRDAIYFHGSKHIVTAVDVSDVAIRYCHENYIQHGVNFLCGTIDAVKSQFSYKFDVVYSRFSLHAMTIDEENEFMAGAYQVLDESGYLFIECRSINDPLARKGEILSSTERIYGHYRRFIVLDEFKEKLHLHGFTIIEAQESSGLAVLGDDDPVVIRVVAVKQLD